MHRHESPLWIAIGFALPDDSTPLVVSTVSGSKVASLIEEIVGIRPYVVSRILNSETNFRWFTQQKSQISQVVKIYP